MSPLGELSFKRWKDRRKAQDHFFIAFQSTMLSLAVVLLIYRLVGMLFEV